MVMIGTDSHKRTHTVVALEGLLQSQVTSELWCASHHSTDGTPVPPGAVGSHGSSRRA